MFYDCHLHTNHSHDSKALLPETCRTAISSGLSGIAVTDHCDIEFYHTSPQRDRICASVQEATDLRAHFCNELNVLRGIELGESIVDPAATQDALAIADFDFVIGSVHAFFPNGELVPYSWLDFSTGYSDRELHALLARYFSDVAETIETVPVDTLAHLTCPLRYINGKYHRNLSLAPHAEQITAILRRLIEKQIALELNASGLAMDWNTPMPDQSILQQYRSLGGTLLTLGTDTHDSAHVGYRLTDCHALLREIGFTHAYYYEKRTPIAYPL